MDNKLIKNVALTWICVIVIWCALPITSFAQQDILDNQSLLLEELISSLSNSELAPGAVPTVRLTLKPSNSIAETHIHHLLTKAGYRLSTRADTTLPQLEINFDSENTIRKHRRNQYTRSLNSSVTIFLIEDSQEIKQSVRFDITIQDRFESDDFELLASGWYPARFHDVTDTSLRARFKRYGEPVLITSAIATSIYLLYNVRSQ